MNNVLWTVAIMVPLTAFALWANLGRPPRILSLGLVLPVAIIYGLVIVAAIAALIWSFFA